MTSYAAGSSSPLTFDHLGQISPDIIVPTLSNAATKYGVPLNILSGVLGQETNFGADMKTNPQSGATGPFQFLPSTAQQYAYPLTNKPTLGQFQQQADAAAHYLSDLFHQKGSWNAAITAYSGGGYGLSQVQQQSGRTVPADEAQATSLVPGIGISNPLTSVAGAISGAFNQAVSDAKYAAILVVAIIVGGYLIVHGLTGQKPPSPTILARGAAAV